jgi:hypothetical protein
MELVFAKASTSEVGTTRFELATTRPPDVYSTELSYVPYWRKEIEEK